MPVTLLAERMAVPAQRRFLPGVGAEPLGSAAPDGGGQCAGSGCHGGRPPGPDHAAPSAGGAVHDAGDRRPGGSEGAVRSVCLQAGYTRCDQVEGVGQFALRGGILDVFSPLMEQPVRCEFFDDEIDSHGRCSTPAPSGGRKTCPPHCCCRRRRCCRDWPPAGPAASGGASWKSWRSSTPRKRTGRRSAQTLRGDAERFRNGAEVDGLDRYLDLIYPDAARRRGLPAAGRRGVPLRRAAASSSG